MNTAVCFRCDWEGQTLRSGCPRCGAPLFRPTHDPARSGRTERHRPTVHRDPAAELRGDAGDRSSPLPVPEPLGAPPGHGEEPPIEAERSALGRWGRAAAVLLAFSLLAGGLGIAWSRLRPQAPPAGPASEPSPGPGSPGGRIVFVADTGRLRAARSLWVLDLESASLQPGPSVLEIDDLRPSAAGPDWLVTTRRTVWGQEASLLRGVRWDVHPERIAAGDLVAWGPDARVVVVAEEGEPESGTCRRPVSISRIEVVDGSVEPVRDGAGCGRLLSLGATAVSTYYSRAHGDRVHVYRAGLGYDRRVLLDRMLLSTSPRGALFVSQVEGATGIRPGPRVPSRLLRSMRVTTVSTEVFWRSRDREVTLHDPGLNVAVVRVLDWSPDETRAALLARVGDGLGIFLIEASPGARSRALTFLGPADRTSDAAFAADGTLFLATGGALSMLRDGEPEMLLRPRRAPRLTGPIAWLP